VKAARAAERARTRVPQPAPLETPKHGHGKLRRGNPGNRGGGREPEAHRDWCREMISDPAAEQEVRAILLDRNHPAYAAMWREVAARGYGKPTQTVEHTGAGGEPIEITVTRRIIRPADTA
jgi:hypothetical protein